MAVASPDAPHVHVTARSDMICAEDVRAMLRLEGEIHELPPDPDERQRHALLGLAALVGAQVAMLGELGSHLREGVVIRRGFSLGWAGDRERGAFEAYLRDQRRMPDPSIRHMAGALRGPVTTFNRTEILSDREWYGDPHVQEYRRAARVDAFLHSVRVERDAGHVISFHRPWGERPFTERERLLVDVFHRESRALAPRSPQEERLSPHLDRTLRALLRGLSEKEAAAELGLSPHTVHEYVKVLYRRHGVRSRSELLARFVAR